MPRWAEVQSLWQLNGRACDAVDWRENTKDRKPAKRITMEWTRLTKQTMPDFMEEVFIALNDGNYAVAWLRDNPTPTFTNIHGDVWWVHEVSHWMYPTPPKL